MRCDCREPERPPSEETGRTSSDPALHNDYAEPEASTGTGKRPPGDSGEPRVSPRLQDGRNLAERARREAAPLGAAHAAGPKARRRQRN